MMGPALWRCSFFSQRWAKSLKEGMMRESVRVSENSLTPKRPEGLKIIMAINKSE